MTAMEVGIAVIGLGVLGIMITDIYPQVTVKKEYRTPAVPKKKYIKQKVKKVIR